MSHKNLEERATNAHDVQPRGAAASGHGYTSIPDFGDVVGLTRLYRQAVERIRQSAMTEEEKVTIIGMIGEEYRAALAVGPSS